MLHQVHRETCLAHGGATRHDHQVRPLQPGCHAVQLGVSGAEAGDVATGVVELVDSLDRAAQQRVHFLRPARLGALLADLHDLALGLVDQLVRAAAFRVVAAVGNILRRLDQVPQGGAVAHYGGIGPDVGCAGGLFRQFGQVGEAARIFQLAAGVECLGDGDRVNRLIGLRQPRHVAVDQSMVRTIEIAERHLLRHSVPAIVCQQQAAQHRLLRLDGMRQHLDARNLGIVAVGDDICAVIVIWHLRR